MNAYRQSRDLLPFALTRDDMYALWDLLLKLLPRQDAQHEWQSVSTNLGHVEITEATLEEFLENPELPVAFSNLAVSAHKNFDMREVRKTYSIRISLRSTWASVSADGPDEAWAIGAVEQIRTFFNAHRRPLGRFLRFAGSSIPVLIGIACGMGGVTVVSFVTGDWRGAILNLLSAVILVVLAVLAHWRKVGEVTRIRLDERAARWSLELTLALIACAFAGMSFVVAVLQLLGG